MYPRCFYPLTDVVAPVDFTLPPGMALPPPAQLDCEVEEAARSGTLLFMSGSYRSVLPEYSQGVRQRFYRLHARTAGVVHKVELMTRSCQLHINREDN